MPTAVGQPLRTWTGFSANALESENRSPKCAALCLVNGGTVSLMDEGSNSFQDRTLCLRQDVMEALFEE
jgi:hypothetical protein